MNNLLIKASINHGVLISQFLLLFKAWLRNVHLTLFFIVNYSSGYL